MDESIHTPWRAELIAAGAIGVITLLPRLVLAVTAPAVIPVYDMADYWNRAIYIAEHAALYPNSYRMPGYPAALALAFAFSAGPSLLAVRVFNAVAGTAAAVLTYWLARRTASRRASLAAALAVALYPSFLIYTTFIASEVVVTVPLVAALIASTYRSHRAAIVAGLCAALTALVRPAGIALLPAVFFSFVRTARLNSTRRSPLLGPGLVVAAFLLTMTPWWLHNARLHGRFVPLDTSGGMNFAVGNNPFAGGTYRWREFEQVLVRDLPGTDIFSLSGSDRATAMAFRYMRDHPDASVRLLPAKLAALFALEGREHAFFYSFGFLGQRTRATVWIWAIAIMVSFPLLIAAALAGLVVRGGISPAVLMPSLIFLSLTLAMHTLTFGDPRYHLPMVPVLAVLATGMARWRNGISPLRLALAAVALVLLAIAWGTHLATYWTALVRLAAPDGWRSQLAYDDLL
jgi:4-amino-4-deoxy-L-arabinose transferase-like glycosyltransferase